MDDIFDPTTGYFGNEMNNLFGAQIRFCRYKEAPLLIIIIPYIPTIHIPSILPSLLGVEVECVPGRDQYVRLGNTSPSRTGVV